MGFSIISLRKGREGIIKSIIDSVREREGGVGASETLCAKTVSLSEWEQLLIIACCVYS